MAHYDHPVTQRRYYSSRVEGVASGLKTIYTPAITRRPFMPKNKTKTFYIISRDPSLLFLSIISGVAADNAQCPASFFSQIKPGGAALLFRGRLQQTEILPGRAGAKPTGGLVPLQFATGRVWSVEAVKAPVADAA